MIKDYLGNNIPKLGFGLMRLPMLEEDVDIEQLKTMVDRFIKSGFTYFDTAYVYTNGKSEEIAKEVLVNRYPRETFQLATKMPVWLTKTRKDFEDIFNTQLERTGAGYFDYYLLHALDKGRLVETEENGAWDFVKEMKEKGLIKHLGFSFHDSAECLEEILRKHPEAEFVQLQINYVDWESDDVQSRRCYEVARKYKKPIIIMEPIKGGSLAVMRPEIQEMFKKSAPDLSIASWAIRYAASLEGIITVLSGMSDTQQVDDNLSYMTDFKPLDHKEYAILDKVVEELVKIPTIPCTSCKYCVDDCPQRIDIPAIFNCFNNYKIYQNITSAKGDYSWSTRNGGKASDCIACGACEGHCPQHIQIIHTLQEAASILE